MLTPKKKLVAKEIKQDALLTTYVKTSGFYYENRKLIHYALTGVVILAVAVVIYLNNRRTNNEKAAVELSRVMLILDAAPADPPALQAAIDGKPEQGMIGLAAIVENYGGTDAGELARFYLAGAYSRLGEWESALHHYEEYSPEGAMLDAAAKAGAAACHEALGRHDKAAKLFASAADADPEGVAAPEYLDAAARCYAASGRKEEAVEILKDLKERYPASTSAREADRAITRYSL